MWDFSFRKCFEVVFATWPFLILRAVVFGGFTAVVVILVASGALIGHEMAPVMRGMQPHQTSGIGGMAGLVLSGMVLSILREYTLYLVKAGHIAVMTDMLDGHAAPKGLDQLKVGAARVRETFIEASALFILDQMIKAVIKVMDEFMKKVGVFVPFLIPVFAFAQTVVTVAITYVDEMILAHILRTRPANPWKAGADTLVLYAQNAKPMLKNAFWLALFLIAVDVSIFGLFYFLLPIPEIMIQGEDFAVVARIFGSIAGVVLVALIYSEPFAVCAMLQAFDHAAKGQRPDPEMERNLAAHSGEFRKLNSGRSDDGMTAFQPAE